MRLLSKTIFLLIPFTTACSTPSPATSGVVAGMVLASALEDQKTKDQKYLNGFREMVRETLAERLISDIFDDMKKCTGWSEKWNTVKFNFDFKYSSADFYFRTEKINFISDENDSALKKCMAGLDISKYKHHKSGWKGYFPKGFSQFEYNAQGLVVPTQSGQFIEKNSDYKSELFK
jgi:hypothetical protein